VKLVIMLVFCYVEHLPDDAIVQVDDLVRSCSLNGHGDQGRVAALRLELG
jgi:hypothetical protein